MGIKRARVKKKRNDLSGTPLGIPIENKFSCRFLVLFLSTGRDPAVLALGSDLVFLPRGVRY